MSRLSFSSYLFIIVAETLNITVNNAIRIVLIKGISLQIISRYADDISFNVRAKGLAWMALLGFYIILDLLLACRLIGIKTCILVQLRNPAGLGREMSMTMGCK